MKEVKTVILQGFDRSGSTAIARTLASSVSAELFMQPFNGGSVRKKMYQIWHEDMASEEDKSFFKGLEKGCLIKEYIHSPWFEKHSTVTDFEPGKLHLVKTTINHFTTKWVMDSFENMDQWAIWRDPIEILTSLKRNDFIQKWYANAVEEVTPAVLNEEVLKLFAPYLSKIQNDVQRAAFLIAVRSYYLFTHVKHNQVICHNQFKKNPTLALSSFVEKYNLKPVDTAASRISHNLIGKDFTHSRKQINILNNEDIAFANDIFEPLIKLVKEKFNAS